MKPLNPAARDYQQYEYYIDCFGKKRIQYDYRDKDGALFSCVRETLEECREARRRWQEQTNGAKTPEPPP